MSRPDRGFEIVSSYLDKDINLPRKATPGSAGYDFEAAETITILPESIAYCATGIKAHMQEDEVLQIFPRSSLAGKKHLMLANSVGIIDHDFYNNQGDEGHIRIMLYNFGRESQTIEKGERIAQGIFFKHLETEHKETRHKQRHGGLGSTGN
ncbi:MAG: dUTP diphosphatase [Bacilli bacterium]|nr:dUTP diphosphatase [Bacilli bacterium]